MANSAETHITIAPNRSNLATVVARFRKEVQVMSTRHACDEVTIGLRCVNERGLQMHLHLQAADHNQLNQGVAHG
ncbi:hypothetical protein [Burkholderia metallica]|uniref:hypothetical protein n=1 Tax=Burkholderia metallica TaxID=488729 RepID=UPI001CF41A71|nr:hypothetical protein [Burkholderia metallica]MCA8023282.1 hypothetical protein [Burkholderia metallica]